MDINALKKMVKEKSSNVKVDSQKILETMNDGGTRSNFSERAENELKLTLGMDDSSASVKVRLLPSPQLFGYLRDSEGNRFEGMTSSPYYELKTHWISNVEAKKFYVTKCSNTDWNDESCPACNLKKKAILNYKTDTSYHKFLKGKDKDGGLADMNTQDYYVLNVYVIDDKKNPANNGKVMFYKMSKGLFNKVVLPMFKGDDDAGIAPEDVTNVLSGRDLFISVSKEKNQLPDYIKGSRFLDSTPFMPFFERKDKNGANNRFNLVTVPYSTPEEFGELVSNPNYLVDDTLVDANTGEQLLPVVYKLNTRFLDMLINGLEVNGTKYLPMENLAKMVDPAHDPNSFTGDEAIAKFGDLMASYGYDINGDPLAEGASLDSDGYDEPVMTKEQSASVEGIQKNDFSEESVSEVGSAVSNVQVVSSDPVEIKKDENATDVDGTDWDKLFS